MASTIELDLTIPEPPEIIEPRPFATKKITPEQLQALISLLASTDPAIIQLPEGKSFTDVIRFSVTVFSNGEGSIQVVF